MSEDLTQKLPEQPDGRLEELFRLVQSIDTRLSTVTTEVSELKQVINERLLDTQPLGETVSLMRADIGQLRQGQQQLQVAVAGLEEGQRQIRSEIRNVNRALSVLNDSFMRFAAEYKELDERIFHLESKKPS